MFESFNKSTITICCFLGVNILVSTISVFLLLTNESLGLHVSNYGNAIISVFVVLASIYLIIHLHKKEIKALKLCFWFCLLQVVTIESELLTIGLSYGVKIGAVWEIGTAIVTINILALLTLFFVNNIIRGQKRLTSC